MSNLPRGPLRPGARVGAFVIREEIGLGATSIVYEAEHRTLRHRVAVKLLRSSSDATSELRMRFDREMRLCSSLSSLHVPHVYEVGELPSGLPYIVMERLSGDTLATWLAVHRKLPVAVVVEIGIQLCSALTALHERQVLHRDVKPENLVLHRAFADGYVLKLVDFGICKPLLADGLSLTQQGTVVGTPEYMSPEQVQGIEVDARTDVYSTGVVLYELLTGRTPFEGRDLDRLGRAILFASPPRPSSLRPEVSAVLEGIVLRAMARERTDRHPSMTALQRDLERFADEHALRRHPSVWALLPAAGTVVRPPPPPAEPRPARDTQETLEMPRIPVRRGAIAGAVVGAIAVLLTAALSIAYYVYDPFAAQRSEHETLVPFVPEPAPAPPLAPTALDLGPLSPDSPSSSPAAEPASRHATDAAPSREVGEPAASREAAGPSEPVQARPAATTRAERSREARRERAGERRRAARRRARAPSAAPSTTVSFAPRGSAGEPALEPPLAEQPVASITAADVYAQVGARPRASSAPTVPRQPYGDAARAIPESPYGTVEDLEVVDPF